MNVFAHVAVARAAVGPDADDGFLLGAALSDLASFGGFRLLGRSPDERIRAGMAFHHRTDDAFHQHPWFRQREVAARQALTERGLGRGPARACGHVGVELLLDGALHDEPGHRERFLRVVASAADRLPELAPLVRPEHEDRWCDHLRLVSSSTSLPAHDRPDDVARRLHRICSRRPRLAFDEAGVPEVAAVLGALAPGIAATGTHLVAELGGRLNPAG